MSRTYFVLILTFLFSTQYIYCRDWLCKEAEYASVIYPQGLEHIADSLLYLAETSLPQLAAAVDLPLKALHKRKAKIILTDAPDFANGYALDNTVVIYARSSEYISRFTGTEDWYKQVLTHELAHLVMFYQVKRKANWFGAAAYLTIPRWYWEGVAQYLTEPWNAFRGDLYLKNALFNGTFTLQSLYDTGNGSLLYAASHAFVKYLAYQYGDSTISRVLTHNAGGFLYHFDQSFKKAYGAPVSELFPQFVKTLTLYYGNKYHDYPVNDKIEELPLGRFPVRNMIALSPSDSTFLISGQVHPNHRYLSVYEVKITENDVIFLKKLFDNCQTNIVVNQARTRIAYGRYHVNRTDNLTAYGFDWFIYNRQTANSRIIKRNIHARYAVFDTDDTLLINEIKADRSIIHRIIPASMQYDTLITTAIPLGRMSALSQGKIIIEGQETNGNRDLFLLQHRKLINLTDDRTDDRKPVALSDTSFVFTRYLHHHPVTSLYDITRRKSTSLFYDLDDYWPETVDHLNGQLYLSQYKSYNRKKWVRIPLDTVLHDTSDKPIPAPDMRYAGWQSDHSLHLPDTLIDNLQAKPVRFPQFSLTHAFSVALPVYDARDGWGLFGLSSWFEVMQRQMLVTSFILYPEKIEHSFFILNHVIKCCNLDFTSILYQGPVFFTFEQGSHVKLIRRYAGIMATKPVYLSGNPRFMLNPSFACAWQNYNARNALPENSSKTSYGILRAGTSLHYHKPTKLYPFLAKRQVYLSGYLHKAIDFTIYSSDLILGTNMVSESIGIKTNLSWLKKSGSIPPLQILGIDRFYQTNIPRDFGYTKTVRAIREDIAGNEMVWSSSELICVWPGRTPLRLLFIPLNNLAFSLFYDHAFIRTALTDHTVFGYGLESTFGTMHFRYGLGYARGRYSDGSYSDEVYVRFALTIPGLSHMREDYGSDITESGLKD